MIEIQRFHVLLVALVLVGAILTGCSSPPPDRPGTPDDPFAPPPYGEVKDPTRDSNPTRSLITKLDLWKLDDRPFVPWSHGNPSIPSRFFVMHADGTEFFSVSLLPDEDGRPHPILEEIETMRIRARAQNQDTAMTDPMVIIEDTTAYGVPVVSGDLVDFELYVSQDPRPVESRGGPVAVQ